MKNLEEQIGEINSLRNERDQKTWRFVGRTPENVLQQCRSTAQLITGHVG